MEVCGKRLSRHHGPRIRSGTNETIEFRIFCWFLSLLFELECLLRLSVLICRLVCRDFAVRIISPTAFHYVLKFLAKCCVEIMDLEAGQEQTRLSDFLLISFIAIQIGIFVEVISSHLATGLSWFFCCAQNFLAITDIVGDDDHLGYLPRHRLWSSSTRCSRIEAIFQDRHNHIH